MNLFIFKIPEVMIFMNNLLLRGNRTTKKSSLGMDAFESPSYSPIGKNIIYDIIFIM